jgi:hypothetical protein
MIFFSPIQAQIAAVETDPGQQNERVSDIIVVFKMHVDIGYTNLAEGVLQKYTTSMLEETLRSIEETSNLPESEQFVWTIPGWPLKYMLENSSGENKEKLEKAIADGRIVPHALPATYETEASDLETLVRGLSITSEINQQFDLPEARDAKLTDVPSHSWALPTVLINAGVDFLHIGCNPGSASPDVPVLFRWQGPDGSELLTFYWAQYYGSGILPPKDWPYKTWLAMIHTHENTGAPSPEEVAELLKSAKEEMPDVNIKIGRLSDFYDLLMKEDPQIPVIKGDMPDTWIHGYLSKPKETKLSKFLQRETFNIEILNTQLNEWAGTDLEIDKYIKKTAENIMLYDEHTFGLALSHGNQHRWTWDDEFKINKSLGYYDYLETSWLEKANRIHNAERILIPVKKRTLRALAENVGVKGKKIVVYNPLPWPRAGRITMFAGVYQKKFQIYGLKDAESGDVIPVYNDHNLVSFDAGVIPSLGYKTYIPILNPVENESLMIIDKDNNRIENQYFKMELNPADGTVISLFDKQNNKELVLQDSEEKFGQYILERPGYEKIRAYNKAYIKPGAEGWAYEEMIRPQIPNEKSSDFTGSCNRIEYMDMTNAIRATVFGELNDPDRQKYLITYTLYENQPYVEINWAVDGKAPSPLPEAGWLSFPFNINNPEYRLYRTGGIVDPEKDFIDNTNHDYYFLNTSMAMFDAGGSGIGLNCPASPGVSLDSRGLFKFSGTKQLSKSSVFVNLYNNQWGTNFTEWIEGSFSSRMYIWSYDDYDSEESFITPSEETRVPLMAVYSESKEGEIPKSQSGITLGRKGIIVTSYRKIKEGMELRLWEQSGEDGACTVKLPNGSKYEVAYPANLRGVIISMEGIEISGNSFNADVKANKPLSFILK